MLKRPTRRPGTELPECDERVSSDATNSMECAVTVVGHE
jgi:hypothetical protein